ncbi:LOW QUALITY PROTEIN: hypothetical protein U9M48_044132 [Paspalum notatum var. saurae]|uniref:Dof zinc finger protein n=1 Tax=Paspalum notatum var. saurae TaxID=547442 RepID=A0AAQ3UYY9_PASNO
MKLTSPAPAPQQQQLESAAAEILLPQQHHRSSSIVLSRMLSTHSHCDSVLPLPYAAAASGRRAAVLLDHRRYHHHHRPNAEVAPSCPRCDSPNTKFCYYNNYSLSQPRYFCKACRRYWTKGGSLRNVPVGGGCRKNRRGRPLRAPLLPVPAVDAGTAAGGGAAFSHGGPAAAAASRRRRRRRHAAAGPAPGWHVRAGLCRPMDDADDRPAVTSEGSTIDLALLYAKFLNQQPESLDALSGSSSSDMSPVAAPPRDPQPFTRQDGFGDLSAPASAAEPCVAPPPLCPDDGRAEALIGELGFCVDQIGCYDSLGLPQDGGDLVLLPPAWHPGAKYEPFDALPEDAMSLQDGIGGGVGDVWNTAFACQGLEAALCRP